MGAATRRFKANAEREDRKQADWRRGGWDRGSSRIDGSTTVIPRHFQITIALLLLSILVAGIYVVRLKHHEEEKNSFSAP